MATAAIVFVLGLSLSAAGSAQEEKSIAKEAQELVADLSEQREQLGELARKMKENPDLAATAVVDKEASERRESYRRDLGKLVELVVEGEASGMDVAQARTDAVEMLEADATSMREAELAQAEQTVQLIEAIAKGSAEESSAARDQLLEHIPAGTRLVKHMDTNIEQRKQLGLDVEQNVAEFAARLQTRGDFFAAMLTTNKDRIDAVSARPGVDDDPEAQKELAILREHRDLLAETQRALVELMDRYGLETAELRKGIISATGKLSQDILDKEVASGLVESWFADAGDWIRSNGAQLLFQAITFLLVLLGFALVARVARGAVRRALDRSKLDISNLAKEFFIKTTGRLVMLIGVIIAIAQLGVEVGPLLAGLGIAGFVIGFALQDTLSNFASGLMILVYRPFDVGDAVEAGGVLGAVKQMNLVSTMILTFDNQLLIVPNNKIWGGVIRNITHQATRRVDLTFSIGYSDDVQKAEQVLTEIVTGHDKVLDDPAPVVRLHELGESSVNFVARPWVKTSDYWDVYWDITREVKRRFNAEGISIPFPQRDVHVYQANQES